MRLFFCLFLALVPSGHPSIIGYQREFSLYQGIFEVSHKVSALSAGDELYARYGLWNVDSLSFTPYWPAAYAAVPEITEDPYPVIPWLIDYETGELIFTMHVHPYHPKLLVAEPASASPWYGLPAPNEKLGVEILLNRQIGIQAFQYSSVIVFGDNGDGWMNLSDEAKIGQLVQDGAKIAIVLAPEPSSFVLLSAAGLLLVTGRRRK